jgi:tripartite-type tricarboxylate transporter receptor subunit TctC
VAKADPDGYTLLQAAANMSINPITVPDLPFDPVKDFAPVSMTHITPEAFGQFLQAEIKRWRALLAKKP